MAGQNLARDEAGHIWDISDPAHPQLVQSSQGGPNVVMPAAPPKPEFVPGHPELMVGPSGDIRPSGVPASKAPAPTFVPEHPNLIVTGDPEHPSAVQLPGVPATQPGKTLDPAVRQKAIQDYTFSDQLHGVIENLRQKYAAGPGKTKGVMGTADYLPLTRNQDFDTAANAARGIIGQALGFTGGQLNTEHESEMNIGPFLPHSGDRDQVIKSKLQYLKNLADKGKQRSVMTLGGIPDQNGNIQPVDAQSLATGKTRQVADAEASKTIDQYVRSGRPYGELAAYADVSGFTPPDPQKYSEAMKYHHDHPDYKGSFGDAVRTVQTTAHQRISASAPAAAVAGFGNSLLGDRGASLVGAMTGDPEAAKMGLDALRGAHPLASMVGDIGGQVAAEGALGSIPGARALMATRWGRRGADALYGAYAGSGDDSNGDPLTGAVAGAGINLGGGMFGRGATRAVGGTISGVKNAALQKLDNLGVPLTMGQIGHGSNNIAGKVVGGLEDRFAGLPGFDAVVGAARKRGEVGFNQAAFKEAGGSGATGAAGLDELNGLRNNAYSFLNGTSIPIDAQFAGRNAAVRASIPGMPAFGDQVGKSLDVLDNVAAPGALAGRDWQSGISDIRANRASLKGQPFAAQAQNGMGEIDSNLLDLAGRQGPAGTIDNLNAANRLHAQTETLASALDNGPTQKGDQLFTPGRLDDASRVGARKFGGRMASLTGQNRPFYDLTQAGNQVMPMAVKDSGTAGRMMLVPLSLGAAGAGLGAMTGEDHMKGGEMGAEYGALLGAAAAGPYSKLGQKVIQKTFLGDRPDQFVRVGDYIVKKPALGGMFGSGAARNYDYQLNQ